MKHPPAAFKVWGRRAKAGGELRGKFQLCVRLKLTKCRNFLVENMFALRLQASLASGLRAEALKSSITRLPSGPGNEKLRRRRVKGEISRVFGRKIGQVSRLSSWKSSKTRLDKRNCLGRRRLNEALPCCLESLQPGNERGGGRDKGEISGNSRRKIDQVSRFST